MRGCFFNRAFLERIQQVADFQKLKIALGAACFAEFPLVCVCNGRFYGGGFNPVTDAMPDDGLMNILAVNAMSPLKVPALIGKYAKGRYREMSDCITRYDSDRLELSSPEEFVVNIDGEAVFTDRITFALEHNRLSFIFPRDMEFYRPAADGGAAL